MRILVTGQIQQDQFEFMHDQLKKQTCKDFQDWMLIDEKPAKGIDNRRRRIAENHQKLIDYVFTIRHAFDYVIQIEGDSFLRPDTFEKLINRLDEVPADNFGYISGVQVGRHGVYAIGAWHFINLDEFESINHKAKGLVEVDATGFYCLLAPIDVWLKGNCYWNGQRWGPDVNWGLSLRGQGYKIYADMDNEVGHKSTNGIIGLDNQNLCTVKFKKTDQWGYKTE